MRLPKEEELICMCENLSSIPGGVISNNSNVNYWGSTRKPRPGEPMDAYVTIGFDDCEIYYGVPTQGHYVKCVK
jgi:hypothetical protein